MARRNLAGLRVLDAWCNGESSDERRVDVLNAVMWTVEHTEMIMGWPAVDGHPRRRHVAVEDAGVILVLVVWDKPPVFGLQLVAIEDIN
jgi:hypothetical protein